MTNLKSLVTVLILCSLATAVPVSHAGEYKVGFEQFEKAKAFYNDPRPVLQDLSWDKILPPDVYAGLTYDVQAMQDGWAELTGFRSPEIVGRIAPEIKPGKYTHQDREKHPGFKELMWPSMFARFRPGSPPHCGNFTEIEVVPTRQYYMSLPVIETTKKNLGQSKLDDQGYLLEETYRAGIPFPRPSGTFKARQIIYNWMKRYFAPENVYSLIHYKGYTKDLKEDFNSKAVIWNLRLHGRVSMPPYGWFDTRARKRGEISSVSYCNLSPRDLYGNIINMTLFRGWEDHDQLLLYIAQLRRIRKLSGTDTQDIVAGQDMIYDDYEGFSQKITPYRNPYTFELIGEREYLVPAYSVDGSEYFSREGLEWKNLKFERRPCYVLLLTQLDRSYVYGKRVIYIDKETFKLIEILNYDQQGRLYRGAFAVHAWYPQSGSYVIYQGLETDHLDQHSTWAMIFGHPADWITRDHVSMRHMIKKGK